MRHEREERCHLKRQTEITIKKEEEKRMSHAEGLPHILADPLVTHVSAL